MGYSFDETVYLEAGKAVKFGPEPQHKSVYAYYPSYSGYYRAVCHRGSWNVYQVSHNTGINSNGIVNPGSFRASVNSSWGTVKNDYEDYFRMKAAYGKTDFGWDMSEPEKELKCECGTTITMGESDHPEFHSDYCPVKAKA